MDRGEIEFEVARGLKELVETIGVTFSYSLVPSKPRSDGGLGAGWNAWRILLDSLVADHLPDRRPFSGLIIDVILVDDSFSKDLRSVRHGLTERLVLIDRHYK